MSNIQSGTSANPTLLQNLTYSYDAVGNVTSWADLKAGESLTFTYDTLNQLDLVTGAYTDDPSYDVATGNLSGKGGTAFTYGTQNVNCPDGALNEPNAVVTAGTNTYCYDPNGNMVTRTIGGVTYTLTYDYENRLTGISGGGMTAAFVYDADGNRVKTTINNGTPVYTIGNYFETDDTQANSKFYYYEGSTQIAMQQNTALTYLFSDQLGSTTYATDANGNLAFSIKYNAWGGQRSSSGTVSTAFQYTDQRNDSFLSSTIGLYFYNAREYDPSLGRFVQADSVVQNPNNPQDWDRFAYVHNSPIIFTDPTGHDCEAERGWLDEPCGLGAGIPNTTGSGGGILPSSDEPNLNGAISNNTTSGQTNDSDQTVSSELSQVNQETDAETTSLDDSAQTPDGTGNSTGRTDPKNLTEQLALKVAMSNPEAGIILPVKMTDTRWPASDGWVKMAQNINGVEIHYVYNTMTGATADFKFK